MARARACRHRRRDLMRQSSPHHHRVRQRGIDAHITQGYCTVAPPPGSQWGHHKAPEANQGVRAEAVVGGAQREVKGQVDGVVDRKGGGPRTDQVVDGGVGGCVAVCCTCGGNHPVEDFRGGVVIDRVKGGVVKGIKWGGGMGGRRDTVPHPEHFLALIVAARDDHGACAVSYVGVELDGAKSFGDVQVERGPSGVAGAAVVAWDDGEDVVDEVGVGLRPRAGRSLLRAARG